MWLRSQAAIACKYLHLPMLLTTLDYAAMSAMAQQLLSASPAMHSGRIIFFVWLKIFGFQKYQTFNTIYPNSKSTVQLYNNLQSSMQLWTWLCQCLSVGCKLIWPNLHGGPLCNGRPKCGCRRRDQTRPIICNQHQYTVHLLHQPASPTYYGLMELFSLFTLTENYPVYIPEGV